MNYASVVNDKFKITKGDSIVDFREKYLKFFEVIQDNPEKLKIYQAAAEEFKRRYPRVEKFEDLYPLMVGMGHSLRPITIAMIDESMQRDIVEKWQLSLIGNFNPSLVNPVKFVKYEGSDCVWDGLQTTTLLTSVAVFVFGMSVEEAINTIQVPYAEYPSEEPAELRKRFIANNDGSINMPLTKADLAEQMIYARRIDKSKDPLHRHVEKIQSANEQYGTFFTDENRGDHKEPGAITRFIEIMNNKKFVAEDIINVIKYHAYCRANSHVEPLEIDNLANIFMTAREQKITVDDEYIENFADMLNTITGNTWKANDYSKKAKHQMVKTSYEKWRSRQEDPDKFDKRCNQSKVGPTWICQALAVRGFNGKVPSFKGKYRFKFLNSELGV